MSVKRTSKAKQFVISITLIVVLTVIGHFARAYIDYRIFAMVLLLAVSILAVIFDILPVLTAAVLSAFSLNLFFIDPVYHYKIDSAESALLFSIYLLIALVSAVLTNRLRKQERKVRDREEKEKTIRLYNVLFNSLSHELKTPIATIMGVIDTLRAGEGLHLPPENRKELLGEIEIAGYRLNRQVENLLNMSRLESGNLRLKSDWTDINELIFRVMRKLPDSNDQGRVEFLADEKAPLVRLDAGLIETVLYNILHNAIQYTPEASKVNITTHYEDTYLELSVRDHGPGIPETALDKVFDKFYRVPGSVAGGSGLGLSISKGFVEAHGGTLRGQNRPGGGAEFTLLLPGEFSYLKNLKNE